MGQSSPSRSLSVCLCVYSPSPCHPPSLSLAISPFLYLHVPLSLCLVPLSPPPILSSVCADRRTQRGDSLSVCFCMFRFISEKNPLPQSAQNIVAGLGSTFPSTWTDMRSAPTVTSPQLCEATWIQRHVRGFNVFLQHLFVVLSSDQY